MLILQAAAFEDGWAFVKNGMESFLVRPPYIRSNISLVLDTTIEKAISQYGFISVQQAFEGWTELIAFLKRRLIETREAQGIGKAETESIRELLQHAPPRILKDYLGRIENELIPRREWKAALDILTMLVRLDNVKADPDMSDLVANLLDRCLSAIRQTYMEKEELIDEEQEIKQGFPDISQRYAPSEITSQACQVVKRQCVWA